MKKRRAITLLLILVEVTGLEPAASSSQTQKHRFFASFCVLFRAFSSENRAFSCGNVHKFHTVRICRWSRLCSDLKSHIILPTSNEPQAPTEVDFYCHHYSIKERIFQVPSRVNICDAVIKDYEPRPSMHIFGYSKSRFMHIFG